MKTSFSQFAGRLGIMVAAALASTFGQMASGEEIGFVETYALADDRQKALAELIPGTEDYYYYHALYYQTNNQFDRVPPLLEAWIRRHGETERARRIRHRQMLLTYSQSPQRTLDYLKNYFGLQFDHQRRVPGAAPDLPTGLDPQLLEWDRLARQARQRHGGLQGFEDSALWRLAEAELSADERRELLSRITLPDHPRLVDLIVADLREPSTGGFSSLPIHQQLTLEQLDACREQLPQLINQEAFVYLYVQKLHPGPEADWVRNPNELIAYLERVWSFVQELPAGFNSLKAHVLYHLLDAYRNQGRYQLDLFLTYLALPRQVPYIEPRLLELPQNLGRAGDLNADFRQFTSLRPVGNEESLIRDYLFHFLRDAEDYQRFAPYLRDTYLKVVFAEAKILHGVGNPEQWASLLTPEQFQQVRDRVELEFAPDNPRYVPAGEEVTLDVFVKNVPHLLMKVYRLDAAAYYRQFSEPVHTGIALDGLPAVREVTFDYQESPFRRVRREFKLAERPGIYVVDLIGGGISSRALIHLGRLTFTEKPTAAGHEFRVYDERGEQRPNATIWFAGRLFTPRDGVVTIPYSTEPGRKPIILIDEDLATLAHFQHLPERYELQASIYIDREQLLRHRQAKALVRPSLWLSGSQVPLGLLSDVKLTIATTTVDDVASSQTFDELELREEKELEVTFRVPARLKTISVTLTAKVKNLSQREDDELQTQKQFEVNQVSQSAEIDVPHLVRDADRYRLEVLGRSGEPQAGRVVTVQMKHQDFRDVVQAMLKSDESGMVDLGPLEDVEWVAANIPGNNRRQWTLGDQRNVYPAEIHARAGEPIRVPYHGSADEPSRMHLALLEMVHGTYSADRFDALRLEDNLITIEGLPAGDYQLTIKDRPAATIHIQVADGPVDAQWIVGLPRHLETAREEALEIRQVDRADEHITIKLAGANPFTRVHVIATRYQPAFSPFDHLARHSADPLGEFHFPGIPLLYITGRDIGDEYAYILRRERAEKFPGNMLTRPQVLLNPWELRTTETGQQQAEAGQDFAREAPPAGPELERATAADFAPQVEADWSNLDFLEATSVVLANLQPDENGVVTIPTEALQDRHDLHIMAVSPTRTAYQRHTLELPERRVLDLRMATTLDPSAHLLMQDESTILREGDRLVLPLSTEAQWEAVASLADVYRLMRTMSNDPHLNTFQFILNWPELDEERKRELYSEHASHELHFFLYKKDPEFFNQVVRPYLENKRDKTFLDRWLLELPLERELSLWSYQQLNVVERILLGRRLEGERDRMRRHIDDLFDLIPPDPERESHLFNLVLANLDLVEDEVLVEGRLGMELGERPDSLSEAAEAGKATADGMAGLPRARGQALGMGGFGRAPAGAAPAPAPGEPGARDEDRLAAQNGARFSGEYFGYEALARRAREARQLYRQLEKTKELAEQNYYKIPIEQQNGELIGVDAFWRDVAHHDPDRPLLSPEFAKATDNFTEMMFALALLDLPFQPAEHKIEYTEQEAIIRAAGPVIIFHQQIKPAESVAQSAPILVSQKFFRHDDRFRTRQGQQEEKFVDGEMLVDVVYGCKVVVTNPTASAQTIQVLLQVPKGAVPLAGAKYTRSVSLRLEPYHAHAIEYLFYFPAEGEQPHYPVHVGSGDQLLAYAEPVTLDVVEQPSHVDRSSWEYISQNGSPDEVLQFLREENVQTLDLEQIAFRMRDRDFFGKVIDLLAGRHLYHPTLWSYGIYHNVPEAVQQFLQHRPDFIQQVGLWIRSPLLNIDPVERHLYQHLEYAPLVNARAHQLGDEREIVNDRFHAQYHQWLELLSYKPRLDDRDLMATSYYLLLQDRVPESLDFFKRINRQQLATGLQYDYMAAYLDFYTQDLEDARRIATQYASHPVDRWRNRFTTILEQLDEIEGKRKQSPGGQSESHLEIARQAAEESTFDIHVEDKKLVISYNNIDRLRVNFYRMDVELLFSRNPFVQQQGNTFSIVEPNVSEVVPLPEDQRLVAIELPASLANQHLYIEATGDGKTRGVVHYANALVAEFSDNYGQLRVVDQETGRPLPATYIKVYARMNDGRVEFYKDGYTDLRGRFDYATLSTNKIESVQRLAVLVLSPSHGAVVREVAPPAR